MASNSFIMDFFRDCPNYKCATWHGEEFGSMRFTVECDFTISEYTEERFMKYILKAAKHIRTTKKINWMEDE